MSPRLCVLFVDLQEDEIPAQPSCLIFIALSWAISPGLIVGFVNKPLKLLFPASTSTTTSFFSVLVPVCRLFSSVCCFVLGLKVCAAALCLIVNLSYLVHPSVCNP